MGRRSSANLGIRQEIANVLWDELLPEAAQREQENFDVALKDLRALGALTLGQANELERLAVALAYRQAEAAFVEGVKCGVDPTRILLA